MSEHICPTECDDDCEAFCHQSHVPGNKRDHWPEDCPGHPLWAEVAAAGARGRKQAAAEIAERIDAAADAHNEHIAEIAGVEKPRFDGMVSSGMRDAARIARAYAAEQDTG